MGAPTLAASRRLHMQTPGNHTCRLRSLQKKEILIMTKKRLIKLAVKMIIAVLNHHSQHAEVGFFADDPDDVAWLELSFGLNGAKMTIFILNADHHTMVAKAEVYVLQGVADKRTALA